MEHVSKQNGILVLLCENWQRGKHGTKRELSRNTLNEVLAAEKLLTTGAFSSLIIATGYTNGPKQLSEADAVYHLLEQINPDIQSRTRILLERNSYDTATNLMEVGKIIQEKQLNGPITLLTSWSHKGRSRRSAKAFGMQVTSVAAENILGIRKHIRPSDVILTPLSFVDRKGRIPSILTKRRLR